MTNLHPSAAAGTLLAARVLALVDLLPQLGVDAEAVLARAGLSRDALHMLEQGRVHARIEIRLWQAAEHIAGDPALGLRTAKLYLGAGMPSIEGYLARNATNLRAVLSDMDRFARIIDDRMRMVLIEHGDTAVIRLVRDHPPDRAQGYVEGQFAVMHAFAQQFIGPVPLLGVQLRRAKPRKMEAYREAFSGVTPRFGQPYNEMWFPRAALALPVKGADPELFAILEGHAKLLTELVPREDPFIERVRAALVAALERGRIDVEAIARAAAVTGPVRAWLQLGRLQKRLPPTSGRELLVKELVVVCVRVYRHVARG
jgi:hypothetical protein